MKKTFSKYSKVLNLASLSTNALSMLNCLPDYLPCEAFQKPVSIVMKTLLIIVYRFPRFQAVLSLSWASVSAADDPLTDSFATGATFHYLPASHLVSDKLA